MVKNEYPGDKKQSDDILDEYTRIYYSRPAKWNDAYEWYTADNSPELNEAQQNHFVQILNQKGYNLRLLIIGAIWIVVCIIFVILNPFSQYHNVGIVTKVLFLMAIICIYILHVLSFRRKPYNLAHRLLPELFACSAIFLYLWV